MAWSWHFLVLSMHLVLLIACWTEPPVAPSDASGSVQSWPANGSQNVPPNLRFVAFRFQLPELPTGQIRLEEVATEIALPVTPLKASCAAVGWPSGSCVVAQPSVPLRPNQNYKLSWQTQDSDHSEDARTAVFHTHTSNDNDAPSWQPSPCAIDEIDLVFGCVLPWDVALETRVFISEAARVWLRHDDQTASAVAHHGTARLAIAGLRPGSRVPLELVAADAADHSSRVLFAITTAEDLPTVSITKVMTNPRGAEPEQEFIEIRNFGDKSFELFGFQISDDPSREGDIIQHAQVLGPQQHALIVPMDFDPRATSDIVIPPGLPLIHLDKSLAYGGLTNAGEPLFLRDQHGRRLSGAPAMAAPEPGACMVRTSPDPRSDRAEHFSYEPMRECAPGSPLSADD